MNIYQAAFLGIVQGLTEFLPISSSGHLVLMQNLLGFHEPEIFFDICLHLGTLAAVCAFLWKDLLEILKSSYELVHSPSSRNLKSAYARIPSMRLLVLVIMGTAATVVIALLFRKTFETMFSSLTIVGAALVFTGAFLWYTRSVSPGKKGVLNTTIRDALFVGLAQALAIVPGISRSGATISCGLYLGLDRQLAVRLSFLLSIPAILGAAVLQFDPDQIQGNTVPIIVGGLCSAASGFLALKILSKLVLQGRLWIFAFYCWALGWSILIFGPAGVFKQVLQ